jgi:hypothetical protein
MLPPDRGPKPSAPRIFAYGHSNPDVVIVEKAFAHA